MSIFKLQKVNRELVNEELISAIENLIEKEGSIIQPNLMKINDKVFHYGKHAFDLKIKKFRNLTYLSL